MSKQTYEKRKSLGLCVKCGIQKAREGYVCCEKCADKDKIHSKQNRDFLTSLGLCYRCGKNKLFGNEKTCPECLADIAMYRTLRTEEQKQYSKEYYKKDIERLKKLGKCRLCRKRDAAPGKTYCERCLTVRREKYTNGKILRSERYFYGLCYLCGKELDTEAKICSKCAETCTRNIKNANRSIYKKQNDLLFVKKG